MSNFYVRTEEQTAIIESVRRFVNEHVVPVGAVAVRDKMFHTIEQPPAIAFFRTTAKRSGVGNEVIRSGFGLSDPDCE